MSSHCARRAARGGRRPLRWFPAACFGRPSLWFRQKAPRAAPPLRRLPAAVGGSPRPAARVSARCRVGSSLPHAPSRRECRNVARPMFVGRGGPVPSLLGSRDVKRRAKRRGLRPTVAGGFHCAAFLAACASFAPAVAGTRCLEGSALPLERWPKSDNVGTNNLLK